MSDAKQHAMIPERLESEHDDATRIVTRLRQRYLRGAIRLFALLSVYIALISVMRSVHTGWLPLYFFQCGLALLLLILSLVEDRLGDRLKVALLVSVAILAAISGVLTFGLLGTGFFYFVLAGLFLAIFVSRNLAYLVILLGALVLVVVGYLHTEGQLAFEIDPQQYMLSMASWWTVVFGPFVAGGFLAYIMGDARENLLKAMAQLDASHREIRRLSLLDSLTGLPNLAQLELRYVALREDTGANPGHQAVLILDISEFRDINRQYGHLEGDYVLRELAQRLRFATRGEDLVIRLGGDQFLVWLNGLGDVAEVDNACRNLLQVAREPFTLARGDRRILNVCIGAAWLDRATRVDLKQALHKADEALDAARLAGTNHWHLSR